jgi:hypothetical protein
MKLISLIIYITDSRIQVTMVSESDEILLKSR